MRATLNDLAEAAPDWLVKHVPVEWYDRYGTRIEQYRLPKKEDERKALADKIGHDGHILLNAIYDNHELTLFRDIKSVETLR